MIVSFYVVGISFKADSWASSKMSYMNMKSEKIVTAVNLFLFDYFNYISDSISNVIRQKWITQSVIFVSVITTCYVVDKSFMYNTTIVQWIQRLSI